MPVINVCLTEKLEFFSFGLSRAEIRCYIFTEKEKQ
jgi:hypothetical protein